MRIKKFFSLVILVFFLFSLFWNTFASKYYGDDVTRDPLRYMDFYYKMKPLTKLEEKSYWEINKVCFSNLRFLADSEIDAQSRDLDSLNKRLEILVTKLKEKSNYTKMKELHKKLYKILSKTIKGDSDKSKLYNWIILDIVRIMEEQPNRRYDTNRKYYLDDKETDYCKLIKENDNVRQRLLDAKIDYNLEKIKDYEDGVLNSREYWDVRKMVKIKEVYSALQNIAEMQDVIRAKVYANTNNDFITDFLISYYLPERKVDDKWTITIERDEDWETILDNMFDYEVKDKWIEIKPKKLKDVYWYYLEEGVKSALLWIEKLFNKDSYKTTKIVNETYGNKYFGYGGIDATNELFDYENRILFYKAVQQARLLYKKDWFFKSWLSSKELAIRSYYLFRINKYKKEVSNGEEILIKIP